MELRAYRGLRLLAVCSVVLATGWACPRTAFSQAVPRANYVVNKSFQLPPKGQPGAPDKPTAVAAGPDGMVHVADDRGLVFVYDSLGVYRRTYGQGQLEEPVALAVSGGGESYVLDRDRKQLLVFGPGGQPLRAFSDGGGRRGELSGPIDLALGPSGYVYVLDRDRAGIQIFSRDGVFIRDIIPGDLSRDPLAIAVGNDGSIYLADERAPTHILVLPPFTKLSWTGSPPEGVVGRMVFQVSRFERIASLGVNHYGTVVVLDGDQGRLASRNRSEADEGRADDRLYGGEGTGRGSFQKAVDIAFDGPFEVMILDQEQRKVERIRLAGDPVGETRPDFDFPIRVTRGAQSIPAPLHDVGYTDHGNPLFLLSVRDRALTVLGGRARMQTTPYGHEVRSYTTDPEIFQLQLSQELGSVGEAVTNDTMVVVTDPDRDRFAVFDLRDGSAKGTFGDNYRDERRLDDPEGVALMSDGRIVVADKGNDRVKIFSPDLASLIASYSVRDAYGVTVSPADEIFVWNEDGDLFGQIPTDGTRFAALREDLLPGRVLSATFDATGNLLILHHSHRVTIIEAGRERILVQLGTEDAFDRPVRVVADREGNIYVADAGTERTEIFRWDIQVPPLAGLNARYEPGAATLQWQPIGSAFVREYAVQAAPESEGRYTTIGLTADRQFEISVDDFDTDLPRYVRVAPVFVTGAHGEPTEPLPLLNFTASAAYHREDYEGALADARHALSMIERGTLNAGRDVRGELLWIAFSSAYALGDYSDAVGWAESLSPVVPAAHRHEYALKLARAYLALGDARSASQPFLSLAAQGPRPEVLRDPGVVELSFEIYRAIRDQGLSADALEYLRHYTRAMPTSVSRLKQVYEDSIAVYDTRAKLGVGFDHWRTANYAEAVRFFEEMLTAAELTPEQHVLCRQVLAAAYYAFGRRGDAEDAFREIYQVDPDFDLQSAISRVRRLYGLTIYNPEMERFFGGLQPSS